MAENEGMGRDERSLWADPVTARRYDESAEQSEIPTAFDPNVVGMLELKIDDVRTTLQPPASVGPMILALATTHLRSPHSKRAYRQALEEFLGWCAATGTNALTKSAVHEYIGELNHLRMSPATINLALCAVRRLVSALCENRLLNAEIANQIIRIKGPRRRGVRLGNWLSAKDAERLLVEPDSSTKRGKRDRAIIAVMVGAGLRRSEVAQLNVAHLQKREDRWVIVDLAGKDDRIRSVPIPAWTKRAIDDWINVANVRSGLIFRRIDKAGRVHDGGISPNAIYQIVRRYAAAVSATIAPHDLRRTFAKLAHEGHAGLDQIQLAPGHSSILTTERYLGILQNLRDAPCDHLGLNHMNDNTV